MTLALPGGLTYGTVRWLVTGIDEDGADGGTAPDPESITGQVIFTPVFERLRYSGVPGGDTIKRTVLPRPQVYNILAGKMQDSSGNGDIRLVACDSPGTTPQGWQYRVDYVLDGGYALGSFYFSLATEQIADLTDVMPESPVNGVSYTKGDKGDTGAQGPTGAAGTAATITGATATGLAAGASPTVTLGGTASARTFAFGIPAGATGPQGATGPAGADSTVPGPAGTITGATATGLAAGASPTVTLGGTASARTIAFGIPAGAQGIQGVQGNAGSTGPAGTVAVGTVTTGAAGSSAAITNSGTGTAAVLNFTIPKGDQGIQGIQGPAGSGAPDATTTANGSVRLAGDLAGTAAAPTVPGLAGKVGTGRLITAGTGLTGGGDLSADRTLAVVYGTAAGTAAQGNDSRLSDARTPTTHTHPAAQISDSTTVGRALMVAADAATARTAIGAGTSSLVTGTAAGTAAAGNDSRLSDARTPLAHATTHASGGTDPVTPAAIGAAAASHTHTSSQVSDSTAVGRSVLTAASAAAARSAIGAGLVDSSDSSVLNVVKVTQAAFNAITTPVSTTLYAIVG